MPSAAPDPAPPEESCGNHPGFKVRYHCQNDQCGFLGCSACVKLHVSKSSGQSSPWCWKCGERVIEIKSTADVRAEQGAPFYEELGKVFTYPFAGDGLIVYSMLTIAWGFATLLKVMRQAMGPFGFYLWFASLSLFAYLSYYPLIVLRRTARGEREMPDLNLMYEPGARFDIFCMGLVSLFYLFPTILIAVLEPDFGGVLLLLLLQLVLYVMKPMGIAIYADHGSLVAAISPYHVVREICKVPREYAILWALNIPMLVIVAILFWLDVRTGNPLLAKAEGGLLGGMAVKLLCNLITYYFMIIQAHMMGRILRERKDVLTWAG